MVNVFFLGGEGEGRKAKDGGRVRRRGRSGRGLIYSVLIAVSDSAMKENWLFLVNEGLKQLEMYDSTYNQSINQSVGRSWVPVH